MKFIDLFCGIGGFHHALSKLGHECVFACDIDLDCNEVYAENWNMISKGDIRNLKRVIPDHDVLCAGFPCQPFSKSGKQEGLRNKVDRVVDSFSPRIQGTLFGEIKEIIDSKRPNFVFLENVQNLESHDGGRTLRIIRGSLSEMGYYCREMVISPHEFGIPQNRPRIFIVAINRRIKSYLKFKFPEKENIECNVWDIYDGTMTKDISDSIQNVLDHWTIFMNSLPLEVNPPSPTWSMEFGRSYGLDLIHPVSTLSKTRLCQELAKEGINVKKSWSKEKILNFYPPYIRKMTEKMPSWKRKIIIRNREFWKENKNNIPSGWLKKVRSFSDTQQKFEWHVGSTVERDVMKHMIHMRPSGIRISKMDKIPALVAIKQIPIIGPWGRKITPREAARAQSFDDDFRLHEKKSISFKQLGNSVNVEVVKRIMEEIENIALESEIYREDIVVKNIKKRFKILNR